MSETTPTEPVDVDLVDTGTAEQTPEAPPVDTPPGPAAAPPVGRERPKETLPVAPEPEPDYGALADALESGDPLAEIRASAGAPSGQKLTSGAAPMAESQHYGHLADEIMKEW